MAGFAPEILDVFNSAGAVAWPVFCLLAGLLAAGLRYERARRVAVLRELRDSESRYRAIFETAVDAIIVSDQHGIIREFSKAAEAMTGYQAAELIGQNMRVLLPHTMRRETERYTARFLWTVRELEVCRKDGSVFPAHLSIAEWWAGGHRHFTGILRDLSAQHREQLERTKLEAQLHQAQKMEAIGNLTGGMAHDFNNMLGVVIGNMDLLRDLKSEDPDVDELTGEALTAAFHGAELTRRLLAFARQQPLRPQRVDVNELVSSITRLLRRTLGEDVEIALDLAPELWGVVVDPAQLEASLTNLATNARDAMPDGGRLLIVTGNRTLDADYAAQHAEVIPGAYVMLEVSDTGRGMTREVIDRIFEPFFTTKSRDKGTGLGLSMVFGFIKQSGGHIGVYSEPGIGTTFRLFLPRMTEDAPIVEDSGATPLLHGRGETVLVVEDNTALRRVVMRQLAELGYRVLAAENAAAGLKALDRQSVDLLLTDVVMPGGINGRELARRARKRWPGIKIVFTSGFSEARLNGDAGPLAACKPLLSKPYRKEDLASAAREALDRVA
ncbi:MAG TPA: PAS domain S-box protein [Stellaceae bacterium]|nr:PAS domain S-box protein [Stellaceae bacterium]